MDANEPTRTCSKCGKTLPATLEFFIPNKGGKYGLRPDCRECHQKISTVYKREHREYVNTYARNYYRDNKDRILARVHELHPSPRRMQRKRMGIPEGYKLCQRCQISKPLTTEYFYWHKTRGKSRFAAYCKICCVSISRQYRQRKRAS